MSTVSAFPSPVPARRRGAANQDDRGDLAVRVRDLHVRYGTTDAVRGVDLNVERGRVLALLGPNGAGKTSIVSVLAGLQKRTSGEVQVLGTDPAVAGSDWRARVGVVFQRSEPEPQLTVRECMQLYAGYYPAPRPVQELIELVGLTSLADRRCARLSGGERRRLDVALALVGNPELIFLDEPTAGFDPVARRVAWELLERLRAAGTTMLLTTHYMEEAERLADRISVLVDGTVRAEAAPAELGKRETSPSTVRLELPPGLEPAWLTRLPSAAEATIEAGRATVLTHNPAELLHHLTGWATEHGHALRSLSVTPPTLEEVYTELIEEDER
jgi:ABC-2 type transport system ATP-binding protein